MSFVVKTSPMQIGPGQLVEVCEKPFYGGDGIAIGDEVFIWFEETRGGVGLAASGILEAVEPGPNGRLHLHVRIAGQAMGVDELAPYRDLNDGSPISGLSHKLFRQAHNKIAALDDSEASLLRAHLA